MVSALRVTIRLPAGAAPSGLRNGGGVCGGGRRVSRSCPQPPQADGVPGTACALWGASVPGPPPRRRRGRAGGARGAASCGFVDRGAGGGTAAPRRGAAGAGSPRAWCGAEGAGDEAKRSLAPPAEAGTRRRGSFADRPHGNRVRPARPSRGVLNARALDPVRRAPCQQRKGDLLGVWEGCRAACLPVAGRCGRAVHIAMRVVTSSYSARSPFSPFSSKPASTSACTSAWTLGYFRPSAFANWLMLAVGLRWT